MEDVEAELRLPHIQNSQSRGFAALTRIANCPSDSVRWRRLLNIVQCGPCPLCHPRAGWRQLLDFHHRDQSCLTVEGHTWRSAVQSTS